MQTIGFWLAGFFLIVLAVIGAYDCYALWWLPAGNTVSYYLRDWSEQLLVLPLLVGILLGHLFFPLPR